MPLGRLAIFLWRLAIFLVSVSVSTACLSRQRSRIGMLEEIHDIVTTKRCNREEHLGRTRAQPLRRCTTKNHLEAKDVEAENVEDVAAWPLAEVDVDVLGDVEGREGPEADRALVSQAAEDGVLLEADVVAERGATSTTSRLGGSRQG